jgi:signal peptidase I
MKAGTAVAGQVITFRDPDGGDRLITHRVRTVSVDKGLVSFVTRGDANNAEEEWHVRPDGQVGLVTHRIPLLGYALQHLSGREGPLLLITLPCLLLGALELRRIWRKR